MTDAAAQATIDIPAVGATAVAAPAAADVAPVAADVGAAADAAKADLFSHTAEAGPLASPADAAKPEAADVPKEGEKPADAKPAETEAKPDAEAAKPDEPKPDEAKAEPVVYEFKFPEGFTADKEGVDAATEIFRKHGVAPEAAQEMMDAASAAIGRALAAVPEQQQRAFVDTKKGWLEQAMADPIIGGPAWKTSVAAANDVLANTAIIPKSERKAFNQMLLDTGTSHHPQMMKFLNRINVFLREPAAPPPAINPPKGGNQAGGRKGAILTHPTSKAS